jgi:hypothetical protein
VSLEEALEAMMIILSNLVTLIGLYFILHTKMTMHRQLVLDSYLSCNVIAILLPFVSLVLLTT